MSRTRRWITMALALIALALIGWNMSGFNQQDAPTVADDNEPSSQSQHTVTTVFNPVGQLNYKLVAEDVQNFSAKELTWFTKPVMTLFGDNAVATWTVRADRAKLTDDKMLYLYGHVEVDSLTADAQLKKIRTDNAQVNLITQDVASDDEVSLFGIGFTSDGMRMRGNLRDKTAELIEKVKTSYEIQK
ncbi:LPS export ABC transporter periplasmic protein LptC [Yersinia similis]|uniref:Lipopolysaccharide export system protein LptC n=1 Tax=Yersinia similis TaxID=367190 RepID=A0A0T9Q9F7_9GAMM|nr:LPS export ABC transporter periplasmic protein LptC [Yersinia similis]AHK18793.1 lipopolysaccharide transporter [Yersinia similis]CFQ57232.1 lipopolysaccharide exporter periplasmic protein [Yersinia similis]CNE82817.1 lipopolysaccharide exporter periplasmic protein [Yersinia similis]CNF91439.1 lipopolysaccharide exporter periplasmic protein [Yersinia similis]CNI01508.1 lipopolysaccharide exporter periplasmic protein [Yersinia similis]